MTVSLAPAFVHPLAQVSMIHLKCKIMKRLGKSHEIMQNYSHGSTTDRKQHREEKHHQAKTPLHKKHQREKRRRKNRVLESVGDIERRRKKNRKNTHRHTHTHKRRATSNSNEGLKKHPKKKCSKESGAG